MNTAQVKTYAQEEARKTFIAAVSAQATRLGITAGDLRAGRAVSRRYRNRRIGAFLKELDLTEGRSTGISKILQEMAINGSPVPEFEIDEDRTYFLIRLPIHERVAVIQAEPQDIPQVTPMSPPKSNGCFRSAKVSLGGTNYRSVSNLLIASTFVPNTCVRP